jgi:UDP-N-acetylglucosamine/UDP-N-acetylgalactosamine diphosphorylase
MVQLDDASLKQLVEQLQSIDPFAGNSAFEDGVSNIESSKKPRELVPLDQAPNVSTLKDGVDREQYRKIGFEEILAGHCSVAILAGGQATRLRCITCKGEFEAGWPSHEPLYQLLAERVQRLKLLASASTGGKVPAKDISIPICIMTSPATDAQTREFFAKHEHFGIDKSELLIFQQHTVPCFSETGKLLMESASRVAVSPDGNGGFFAALKASGALAQLRAKGVEHIQVMPVDNVASRIGDPVFTGYCIATAAKAGTKFVEKTDPEEKVGLFALEKMPDGSLQYASIEYSELTAETAAQKDSSGRLYYRAGNTCIHWFKLDTVEGWCTDGDGHDIEWKKVHRRPWVRFHFARKSIPVIDAITGSTVDKETLSKLGNTGIKLETFMFDAFPSMTLGSMAFMEVERADEFLPIKNASGCKHDSPETALAALTSLHRQWLHHAGVKITGAPDARVEVSPLVSYAGEGLEALAGSELPAPLLLLPMPGSEADKSTGVAAQRAGHAARITPVVTVVYV